MLLKLFLISVVLLTIAGLGFGVKRLFDKNAQLPASSCGSAKNTGSCGCGGHSCQNT